MWTGKSIGLLLVEFFDPLSYSPLITFLTMIIITTFLLKASGLPASLEEARPESGRASAACQDATQPGSHVDPCAGNVSGASAYNDVG
jgi:hypothetical protein